MQLTSTAFQNIESIPVRHTGDGEDLSPPLLWSDIPTNCVSLALFCEDPDAPQSSKQAPFVHWALYNFSPQLGMLPEGIPQGWRVDQPVECEQGLNSMGRPGYNGPYPPVGGGMHRYFFRLYALSKILQPAARPMRNQLFAEMNGAILGTAKLLGTYERVAGESRAAG